MVVNSSNIKDQTAPMHPLIRALWTYFPSYRVCPNSTDHSPQMRTSSDSKFVQATRRWNKALQAHELHRFFLFRRRTRTADEARGKIGRRNAAWVFVVNKSQITVPCLQDQT
ncbi:hypothetical protein AVEN_69103-1 [Araneus ventricosus]|uniref:Uncharacterized protein n=1 Tax=Araneus ventricosus TaxID=182803 RepID=A0A4Y2HLW2_ARAVE|nr:hypothetical protein AVEN_69103-1 [Araneus ventricosus]